jgi:hypothetical protein
MIVPPGVDGDVMTTIGRAADRHVPSVHGRTGARKATFLAGKALNVAFLNCGGTISDAARVLRP